jgi:hypothetical protein
LTFKYYIDGQLVYTDLTGYAAGFGGLQTVFLEANNFGFPPYPEENYSVYWRNLNAQPALPFFRNLPPLSPSVLPAWVSRAGCGGATGGGPEQFRSRTRQSPG